MGMNPAQTEAEIARAIRRSRQSRAAMRSRRRRSALLLGLIAASLGGAGIWSIGAVTGNDMVQAAVDQANSLADLLGARSPGRRTVEELSKHRHSAALAKLRPAARRHPGIDEKIAPRIAMVDLDKLIGSPSETSLSLGETPSPPSLDMTPPSIGTIVTQPPGNGPPGGSPPPVVLNPPNIPVPAPSAVPEPGTWTMMLLGFALVGSSVRRQSHARRELSLHFQ